MINELKEILTECTDEFLAIGVMVTTLGVNSIQILRGFEPVFPWEAAMLVLGFYFMKHK